MLEFTCRFELPRACTHVLPLDLPHYTMQGYNTGTSIPHPRLLAASGRLHLLCYNAQTQEMSFHQFRNGNAMLVWSQEFHLPSIALSNVFLIVPHDTAILLAHNGTSTAMFNVTRTGLEPSTLEPPNLTPPAGVTVGPGRFQMVVPITHALLMPWIPSGQWPANPNLIFYRSASGDSHVNYGLIQNPAWGWSESFMMRGAVRGLTSISYIGMSNGPGSPDFLLAGAARGAAHFYARENAFIGTGLDITQEEYSSILATGWRFQIWRWIGCYESPEAELTDFLGLDNRPGIPRQALFYEHSSGRYEILRISAVVQSDSQGVLHAESFRVERLAAAQFKVPASPVLISRTGEWLFRYTPADGLLDLDHIAVDS